MGILIDYFKYPATTFTQSKWIEYLSPPFEAQNRAEVIYRDRSIDLYTGSTLLWFV